MSDNPDQDIKNEERCSHLSTYFKRHMAFKKANESLSVQTKFDSFFNLHYYVQKQIQLLSFIFVNKYTTFL
jgi:hypothetical protein